MTYRVQVRCPQCGFSEVEFEHMVVLTDALVPFAFDGTELEPSNHFDIAPGFEDPGVLDLEREARCPGCEFHTKLAAFLRPFDNPRLAKPIDDA